MRAANYEANRENIKKLSLLYSAAVERDNQLKEKTVQDGNAQEVGDMLSEQILNAGINELASQVAPEILPVGPENGGIDSTNITNEAFNSENNGAIEQSELSQE